MYTYAIGYICISYSSAHTLYISDTQGEIILVMLHWGWLLVHILHRPLSNRNIYVILSSFPVVSTPEFVL